MKIKAVIFTFPLDYDAALIAAASLENLGVEVHFAIDAKHELLPDFPNIIRTTFFRSGNLNGRESVVGQLETMKSISEDSDWVLKVDSDTLVTRLNWLHNKTHPLIGVCILGVRNFFGACYAIKSSTIDKFVEEAKVIDLKDLSAEDLIMFELGKKIGYFRYHYNEMGPVFAGWHWNNTLGEQEYLKRFEIIVVSPPEEHGKTELGRRLVKKQMEKLYVKRFFSIR